MAAHPSAVQPPTYGMFSSENRNVNFVQSENAGKRKNMYATTPYYYHWLNEHFGSGLEQSQFEQFKNSMGSDVNNTASSFTNSNLENGQWINSHQSINQMHVAYPSASGIGKGFDGVNCIPYTPNSHANVSTPNYFTEKFACQENDNYKSTVINGTLPKRSYSAVASDMPSTHTYQQWYDMSAQSNGQIAPPKYEVGSYVAEPVDQYQNMNRIKADVGLNQVYDSTLRRYAKPVTAAPGYGRPQRAVSPTYTSPFCQELPCTYLKPKIFTPDIKSVYGISLTSYLMRVFAYQHGRKCIPEDCHKVAVTYQDCEEIYILWVYLYHERYIRHVTKPIEDEYQLVVDAFSALILVLYEMVVMLSDPHYLRTINFEGRRPSSKIKPADIVLNVVCGMPTVKELARCYTLLNTVRLYWNRIASDTSLSQVLVVAPRLFAVSPPTEKYKWENLEHLVSTRDLFSGRGLMIATPIMQLKPYKHLNCTIQVTPAHLHQNFDAPLEAMLRMYPPALPPNFFTSTLKLQIPILGQLSQQTNHNSR